MAKKLQIGNEKFGSLKAAKGYYSSIRDEYSAGDRVTNEDHAAALSRLLQRHPESRHKIGPGVSHFAVDHHPGYQNTTCFWVHRIDGTREDWSLNKAINACDDTLSSQLLEACRNTVAPSISVAKANAIKLHGSICEVTDKFIPADQLHVDHKPPKGFSTIVDFWVEERQIKFCQELFATDRQDRCQFANRELADDFEVFHRRHSRGYLRLVSARENQREAYLHKLVPAVRPLLLAPIDKVVPPSEGR